VTALAFARFGAALFCGVLFGLGLSVSGMIDPARVLGFLNLASGRWDPSLLFVLGGAVGVAALGVVLQRRLRRPLLDRQFHMPPSERIDRRLVAGSLLFGAGWGLAGFCPGPAVTTLSTGLPAVLLFVLAMIAGMLLHDRFLARAAG
jgi:uncharacterized membrane protein YedE/YeeE